jgi:pyruvate kinase
MPPTILTRKIPRLTHCTGVQITATIRPNFAKGRKKLTLRKKIKGLIEAGVSHFRLNLSHFKPDDPETLKKVELKRKEYESRWRNLVRCIDDVKNSLSVNVFIMLDTAGPEFRINRIFEGKKTLLKIERFKECYLAGEDNVGSLDAPVIVLTMPAGFNSFGVNIKGREVAFKDGDCTAEVVEVCGPKLLKLKLEHPLIMSAGGNIKANFPNFELEGIVSVSARDSNDLDFFLKIRRATATQGHATANAGEFITIDYIAQSFVREVNDLIRLDATLDGLGVTKKPLIIPKIETSQAVDDKTLRSIIESELAAAVMVARGDLGSECKRWMVPSKQREIIRVAHSCLKPVLVATEVYGSMGKYPEDAWQPNRGEVLDLRHALEAGVDGIVFSAETGAREDPVTTVNFAVQQAKQDEKDIEELDLHRAERDRRRVRMELGYAKLRERKNSGQASSALLPLRSVPSAILSLKSLTDDPLPLKDLAEFSTMDWACAAVYRANIRGAAGVFPFTVRGNTVRDMVHFLPYRPIVALTYNEESLSKLALYAHVYPVLVGDVPDNFDVDDLKKLVEAVIKEFKISGDEAFATMPHPIAKASGTDTLVQILCAP